MKNVVEVKNLKKYFYDVHAIDGLSFEVREGEIFGFIGPDGAGKTTALRVISGIMIPTSGEVKVLGYNIPEEAEAIKEHIGYMSQKFNLYTDLTVEENINFFADVFLIEKQVLSQRLEKLLKMTRLAGFEKRLAGNLSGGMKQKLSLICTLIHRPQLLILDEPTTGVDPVSRREFWEILQEIVLEGVTIIISTPYMDEAEWCGRIGLMFRGRIISSDTPQKMKQGSNRVVADVFPITGKTEDLSAGLHSAQEPDFGGIFSKLRCITDIQLYGRKYHVVLENEAALEELKDKMNGIAQVNQISASIEDIFVDKIRKL